MPFDFQCYELNNNLNKVASFEGFAATTKRTSISSSSWNISAEDRGYCNRNPSFSFTYLKYIPDQKDCQGETNSSQKQNNFPKDTVN